MAFLFGFIFTLVIAAVVLLIVDRLNLGLSVDGFGSAIIAALVIAIVSSVLVWLVGLLGITLGATGLLETIIAIIAAAVVLLVSDRFLPGMKVDGFVGAIVAAIAISVITWLIFLVLGALGIGT